MTGAVLVAVLVAAWKRILNTWGFHPSQGPKLYHSDRASQYAGYMFRDLLQTSATKANMSHAHEPRWAMSR